MSPRLVIGVLGGILLAFFALSLLPFLLAGLVIGIGTLVCAAPRHPWHLLAWQYVTGRRPQRWWATAGAVAAAAVLGALMLGLFQSLSSTAAGRFEEAVGAIICGGLLVALLPYIFKTARKTPMPDFLILNSDKLDAFIAGDTGRPKPRLPELDPELLAERMRADVIGQDGIVADVARQVARRIKLAPPNKPLGVFLFVGASGVGKTELAKSLATHAFEGRMTRVDCNELTEAHSAQRLIGPVRGYEGWEQGGQLTRAIQSLGSGVILLDEIEKAHLNVQSMLMGLFDEGRLTEQSTGQVADATQFVIVMTSNAEHERLGELALTVADPDERLVRVKETLAPSFPVAGVIGRIDRPHLFAPLSRADQVKVVAKFLSHFAAQVNVALVAVDASLLVDTVLKHERSAKFGIRELVRRIESAIVDGMLERRDEGFKRVALRCDGDAVRVVGIPEGADAATFLATTTARATA